MAAQPAEKEMPREILVDGHPLNQETVDEYDLQALGHAQALSRKFDLWSILALAFCVLGTWSTFAQVRLVVFFFPSSRHNTCPN